jgi:dienelactone hydrolase
LSYERERTRYLVKAVGRWVVGAIGSRIQRRRTLHVPLPGSVPGSAAAFADLDAHAQWMARQPTAQHVVRILGQWSGAGVTVTYADIHEPDARLRRQILRSENETTSLLEPWAAFVEQTRQAGCIAIDGFTTDARLDQVWRALGGRTVAESEILMKNAPAEARPLRLHGWDRENWTYKAAEHPGSRDRRES